MCGDNLSVCEAFDPHVPQGTSPENEMAARAAQAVTAGTAMTRLSAVTVMTTTQHNRGTIQ